MFKNSLVRQGRLLSKSTLEHLQPRSSPFSRFLHSQPFSRSVAPALPPRIARRWQSTEAEQKPETPKASTEEVKPDAEKEDPLKKEIEQKNREIIDLKDKYLRSVADYRNLQDRTKRDMDSARQFAIQRFATDLLDSIDNLDRALESVPQDSLNPDSSSSESSEEASSSSTKADLQNLHAGIKMTESILMSTLKKHGLERFDPMEGAGRKFDPRLDEATFFTKIEGKTDGEVFHTQSRGYTLNGRVIRAAKVGVVKNS